MKLSDFATLGAAKTHEETVDTKRVGSGQARGYFVNTNDLWKRLRDIQSEITHPFYSVADTIIATALDAGSYFGMDSSKADGQANRVALSLMVEYSVLTQTEANGFIAKTLTMTKPFENVTQSQFNSAKGLFTSKQIDYIAGKDIVVTVNTELLESVAATVWRIETGFEPENAGRNAHVEKAQKYRIDMSGKKSGNYEVKVPLLNADFTVELM